MAFVDLGTLTFEAVRLPGFYNPIDLGDADGNLMLVTIVTQPVVEPTSYLELLARLTVGGTTTFYTPLLARLDLLSPQYGLVPDISFPLPATTVVEFGITRFPIFRGGADGQSLDVQIQVNVP